MQSPAKSQRNKNEILNDIFDSQSDVVNTNINDDDDFNPRGNSNAPAQPQTTNSEFGDFASAFGGAVTKPNDGNTDEFADFTSAFDAGVAISNSTDQQPQISLGASIPNIGNPMSGNLSSPLSNSQNIVGAPAFGASMIQNSAVANNLFNSLPPQGLGDKSQTIANSNNNTGKYIP